MLKKFSLLKKALQKLTEIRTVEQLLAEDYKKNKITSFLHLSIGQEAAAVGTALALKKKDLVFGNHRSHGHYLAKGGNLKKMIYEIYGDKRGCSGGYGGSMHMLDRSCGFVGSTPILGSVAPLISGISGSIMLNNKKNIALGYLGDGAAEEGAFYESINLACLHNLPVIFVIEDNNYSVGIHSAHRKSPFYNHKNIFGSGIGAIYSKVDGQDFLEVFNATKLLRKRVLMEKRPAVIHAKVLRRFVHSGPYSDLDTKERNEKLTDHLKKDPIQNLKKYFIKTGVSVNFINKVISKKNDEVKKIFFDTIKKIKKND